jgi:hypothetical protein
MQKPLTTEEVCRKLKPVFGKKIDEIYLKYVMAESREEREEIAHILNALYEKNLNRLLDNAVLLEPPLQEFMDGDYPLASISYAGKRLYDFNLREQDWVRHICISGMSGSGKTTLAFHLVNNFIEKNKPFLIFDWKKSFRPLMTLDSEVMCFTIGNSAVSNLFKLNINKPPKDVNPKEWINVLCDLVGESFFTSYGVHKVLLETLDDAYKEYGVYEGSQNYPTWNYIKWRLETKLEKAKGREAGWLESALRIASVLTFGDFGNILNYKGKQSISIDELLDKKIIFELNSLGNIEKKFFCEFILTYIYKLKKARQVNTESFEHAILVDEAHNIFLKDKTNFVKESVTDMIYREMREYGTSLICLDQHISKLSDTVKGNSACHIAFQQQLPQDIWDISGIMQLSDKKEYFSKLPVGSAIVRLSERYTMPFLIEVEKVRLRKKIVSDKNIKEKMEFIFEGKEIEQSDDDFSKAVKGELRVPEHALYDGELSEVEKLKSDFENQNNINTGNIQDNLSYADERELVNEDDHGEKDVEEIELTPSQNILYEFVEGKLNQGWDINEIERFMQDRKEQGGYSSEDVLEVINCFSDEINEDFNDSKNLIKDLDMREMVYKKENTLFQDRLDEDEKEFLDFLKENPKHELSTVELYRQMGLSVRKGNKTKNRLLEENKIKIQEIKYNKGWKKIIKLV